MTGENDKNKPGGSFSEEELASALANMENELNSILEDASGLPENGRKEAEKSNSDEKAGDLAGSSHSDDDLPNDDICDDDSILDDLSMDMFDEELEGITGERAECALILTVFDSMKFTAALCKVVDVPSVCIESESGVLVALRLLKGNQPEEAAEIISQTAVSIPFILAVVRGKKIRMTLWADGKEENSFSPPLILPNVDPLVEDVLVGVEKVFDSQGRLPSDRKWKCVDSDNFTKEESVKIIRDFFREKQEEI